MSTFDQSGGFGSPARGGSGGGDAGGFNSPGNTGGKGNRTRVQNLVPCTVNQIRTATKDDDRFLIGQIELGQIELFGVIMDSREASTNVTYMINDFTGEDIQVRHWIDEADDETAGVRESQLYRKHTLIRICGNVREIQGTRSIVAFRIFPVHDYNEFSCHILEVIHAQMLHQMLTKGGGGSVIGMDTSANASSSTIMGSSANHAVDTSYGGSNAYQPVKGLSPIQNQVLAYIRLKSNGSETGPAIGQITSDLASSFPANQVRETVEYLSNEGHVYSTLDDNHFRATDV